MSCGMFLRTCSVKRSVSACCRACRSCGDVCAPISCSIDDVNMRWMRRMLRLLSPQCYSANHDMSHDSVSPLSTAAGQRLPVHQPAPLLVVSGSQRLPQVLQAPSRMRSRRHMLRCRCLRRWLPCSRWTLLRPSWGSHTGLQQTPPTLVPAAACLAAAHGRCTE